MCKHFGSGDSKELCKSREYIEQGLQALDTVETAIYNNPHQHRIFLQVLFDRKKGRGLCCWESESLSLEEEQWRMQPQETDVSAFPADNEAKSLLLFSRERSYMIVILFLALYYHFSNHLWFLPVAYAYGVVFFRPFRLVVTLGSFAMLDHLVVGLTRSTCDDQKKAGMEGLGLIPVGIDLSVAVSVISLRGNP